MCMVAMTTALFMAQDVIFAMMTPDMKIQPGYYWQTNFFLLHILIPKRVSTFLPCCLGHIPLRISNIAYHGHLIDICRPQINFAL